MNNIAVKTPPAIKTLCVLTLLTLLTASDFISAAAEMHVRRYDPKKTKKLKELFTATHDATWNKNSEEMALLVEENADPDAKKCQYTPLLHTAVLHNDIRLVKILVDRHANVDATDSTGETALFNAQSPAMIHMLVRGGADIHHCTRDGKTVLKHAAIQSSGIAVLQTLLELNLDPNKPERDGDTPFHSLCRNRSASKKTKLQGIKLFLLADGLLNQKSQRGDTPRSMYRNCESVMRDCSIELQEIDNYSLAVSALNQSHAIPAYHENLKTLMTKHFNYPTIIAQLTTSYLSPLSIMQALMNWNEKQENEKEEPPKKIPHHRETFGFDCFYCDHS